MAGTDVVDGAAGLSPLSPVVALRGQRAAFVRHTQGSYDALIIPADPAGSGIAHVGIGHAGIGHVGIAQTGIVTVTVPVIYQDLSA